MVGDNELICDITDSLKLGLGAGLGLRPGNISNTSGGGGRGARDARIVRQHRRICAAASAELRGMRG